MMRRVPFKRRQIERTPKVLVAQPLPSNVRMASRLDQAKPVQVAKENLIRDESYLRLVATLACSHCGILGHSQAAHENAGKGQRLKVCDTRTFPLCTIGGRMCHEAFDAYRLVPGGWEAHVALGANYTARTHAALRLVAEHDRWARRIVERTIGL